MDQPPTMLLTERDTASVQGKAKAQAGKELVTRGEIVEFVRSWGHCGSPSWRTQAQTWGVGHLHTGGEGARYAKMPSTSNAVT